MAGPLKTLFDMLSQSAPLTGVGVYFGLEEVDQQRATLPYVVMNPTAGRYESPASGVTKLDPDTEMSWDARGNLDIWLFAAAPDLANQGAIDHADALQSLEVKVLAALQDQQAQYTDENNVTFGFAYKAVSFRWETNTNAVSRFGRAFVITFQLDAPRVVPLGPKATVTRVRIGTQILT